MLALFLSTQRGHQTLNALLTAGKEIAHVLIHPQSPHEHANYTDQIINLCQTHNIPFATTEEIPPSKYADHLQQIKPAALFVISWRFLIPEECFAIPTHGTFVLHDSLLPKYRGFCPTNWVIINGETETGLSLIHIAPEVDSGDLVDQIKIAIAPDETAPPPNQKFLAAYPEIILKNLDPILAGQAPRTPPDPTQATYGCKRTPENGHIDFHQPTQNIVQLIRALTYPYPGACCFYNDQKIFIWEAEKVSNPPNFAGRIPGRIWQITENHVDVITADGLLRITKIATEADIHKSISPKTVFNSLSFMLK